MATTDAHTHIHTHSEEIEREINARTDALAEYYRRYRCLLAGRIILSHFKLSLSLAYSPVFFGEEGVCVC